MEEKMFVWAQFTHLQNLSKIGPIFDPTRPGRHAFEAPITQKLCVLEKIFIRQKMIICFINLTY